MLKTTEMIRKRREKAPYFLSRCFSRSHPRRPSLRLRRVVAAEYFPAARGASRVRCHTLHSPPIPSTVSPRIRRLQVLDPSHPLNPLHLGFPQELAQIDEADDEDNGTTKADDESSNPPETENGYSDDELDFLGGNSAFAATARAFYQAHSARAVPSTYREVMQHEEKEGWQKAMDSEWASLAARDVLKIVEKSKVPKDAKLIGCRWVYAEKTDAEGNVTRLKARLVAQGYTQRAGLDYTETFSPVVRNGTVRLLLAIARKHGMHIHQMDVKTAYLYGTLDKPLYMRPPEGSDLFGTDKCYQLQRALYGLKQAGRMWNQLFDSSITELGFRQCKAEPCVYIKGSGENLVIIAIYVDDVLVMSNSLKLVALTKMQLTKKFEMEDNGKVSYMYIHLSTGLHRRRPRKIWAH